MEEETFILSNGVKSSDMDNPSNDANTDGEKEVLISSQSMKHSDKNDTPNCTNMDDGEEIFISPNGMRRSDMDNPTNDVNTDGEKEALVSSQPMNHSDKDHTPNGTKMDGEEETFTSPNGMRRSDMDNPSNIANTDGEKEALISSQSINHSNMDHTPNCTKMDDEEETLISPNGMKLSDVDNPSNDANTDGEKEALISSQSMKHSDKDNAPNCTNVDDEEDTSTSPQEKTMFVRAIAMKRLSMDESEETFACAQGMKREVDGEEIAIRRVDAYDVVDVVRAKRHAQEDPGKSTLYVLYKLAIAIIGMISYISTFIVDGILLKRYFSRGDWAWFGITFLFALVPLIIIQVLSCKWFHDDNGKLKAWSIVLHVFLLGPLERYWCTLTYCCKKLLHRKREDARHGEKYFANWRDVSMLRFIHSFLETGTQVTFQLYILLTQLRGNRVNTIIKEDAITIIKIVLTVVSLSLSMVAYNDNLRIYEGKGLSIIAFGFQILYRLLLIAGRILALALFATEFKWIVTAILLVHWIIMIIWVWKDDTKFFSKKKGKYNNCFEKMFQVLIGFIYIFCYITTTDGSTAISQMVYYLIFFFETAAVMIAWMLKNDRSLDSFEVGCLTVVFLTSVLGVACMLIYYKIFHPASKRKKIENSDDEESMSGESKHLLQR